VQNSICAVIAGGLLISLMEEVLTMLARIRNIVDALVILGATFGIIITSTVAHEVRAQDKSMDNMPLGRTPVAIVDGKYPASYFPNSELLGAGEMRITALGTGMPNQTRAAVSISYLVELGNGDKFLFDVGSGSMANLFSLRPDFSKLDKVFASHLHVDHVGDFMGLHIGGWLSGRYDPIHIYGPTGSKPELGTKAFIEGMQKGYAWDLATRSGALPDKGAQIVVHEFDYKQENKVVYQENGVTIRSWPAIHSPRWLGELQARVERATRTYSAATPSRTPGSSSTRRTPTSSSTRRC